MTFMQNPPPITVSGQYSISVYQMTLQSANLKEIYPWVPRLVDKMRTLPGFVDVNSDLQIASPQVMANIDRDRAVSLGVTPQQIQDALYSAYGNRQVSTIFTPAERVRGAHGGRARSISAARKRCRSCTFALRKGSLIPLDAVVGFTRTVGPLTVNHFGQLPAVNVSFNLKPGFSLGDAAAERERRASGSCACRPPSAPISRAR